MPFMMMENIQSYINACKKHGITESYLFVTVDLFEGKNMPQVILNINTLKREMGYGFAKTPKAEPIFNLGEKGFGKSTSSSLSEESNNSLKVNLTPEPPELPIRSPPQQYHSPTYNKSSAQPINMRSSAPNIPSRNTTSTTPSWVKQEPEEYKSTTPTKTTHTNLKHHKHNKHHKHHKHHEHDKKQEDKQQGGNKEVDNAGKTLEKLAQTFAKEVKDLGKDVSKFMKKLDDEHKESAAKKKEHKDNEHKEHKEHKHKEFKEHSYPTVSQSTPSSARSEGLFCGNCGTRKNDISDRFCRSCGAQV